MWFAIVDGERYPPHPNYWEAERVMWLWTARDEIDEAEYHYLNRVRDYYRLDDPAHPSVNPRTRRADLYRRMKPL